VPMAELAPKEPAPKAVQDRFVGSAGGAEVQQVKSTKTAEALVPTGGVAAPAK
jgi:hypothetical protein